MNDEEVPFYYVEEQRGVYVVLRRVGSHEKVLERFYNESIAATIALSLQNCMNADRRLHNEKG